jgi:hypothetical protein
VVLRCDVDDILQLAGPTSWRRSHAWSLQHADLLADLRDRPDPDDLRDELLGLMGQVDELQQERLLLAACAPGSPLRPPRATAARTRAWSVYENVIRAAAVWWPHRHSGKKPLTAKAVAAKAFRNSKSWTPERELAFSNLVGVSFDQAVSEADTEIRICKVPEITGRWLCVWAQGYTSRGVLALLSYLEPLPIAAWCDLDADGIGIINDVSQKLKRDVVPVGMDLELWQSTPHRRQEPDQVARDKPIAARLAARGPLALRLLASEIAMYGGSCEQEAIQDRVIPDLPRLLQEVA